MPIYKKYKAKKDVPGTSVKAGKIYKLKESTYLSRKEYFEPLSLDQNKKTDKSEVLK